MRLNAADYHALSPKEKVEAKAKMKRERRIKRYHDRQARSTFGAFADSYCCEDISMTIQSRVEARAYLEEDYGVDIGGGLL